MARSMNAAWGAAIGIGVLVMAAQTHGLAQNTTAKTPQKATAPAPKPSASKAAPAAKVQTASYTGCLRMDGDQFQLTNVEGAQAEKGRSWKTGFIRKSTKNIEIVSSSSSVKLKDQVGHKVSVVGTRDGDAHLKASSIKRVAASCT